LEEPTIGSLLTIGGNAVVVGIALEILKRALSLSGATVDRFAPALAVGLGVALAVGAAVVGSSDVAAAVLTGFFSGAVASGVYSLKATSG